jgi:hypothetical protein
MSVTAVDCGRKSIPQRFISKSRNLDYFLNGPFLEMTNVVLLCGERRVKNIVFTSGDGKNHGWRRPRVVFRVPTSENNVFALLKQAQ